MSDQSSDRSVVDLLVGTYKKLPVRVQLLLENIELILGSIFFVSYFLILLMRLVRRFSFNEQFVWDQPIIIGLFIWTAWVGMAFAIKEDSHLRFTYIRQRQSNRFNYYVYWVEWIGWIVFGSIVFWFSLPVIDQFVTSRSVVPGTNFPTYLFYISVPTGYALSIGRVLEQMVKITSRYRNGEDITVGIGMGAE